MNKSLVELHLQRGRLLERIASQRTTLAQQLIPLKNASETGSRIYSLLRDGVQRLKKHPLPVVLAVVALVLFKPTRAWRWLRRGVVLWRSWRLLRAWVPELVSRWRTR